MKHASRFVAVLIFIFAAVSTVGSFAAQGQRGGGQPPRPATTMDSTPKTFDTAEYLIRVVTVAEGLYYPYSLVSGYKLRKLN